MALPYFEMPLSETGTQDRRSPVSVVPAGFRRARDILRPMSGAWRKTFEGSPLYDANRRDAPSAFPLLVDAPRYRKP